jgi:DNA-binding NtrC family response regulator
MSAHIVLVHDRLDFIETLTADLRLAGYDVTAFADPMAALDCFDEPGHLEILITRVNFGPGKLNGIALGRMARAKRADIQVLFVARPEFAEYAEGVGKFMALPVNVPEIVDTVQAMLEVDQHSLINRLSDEWSVPRGGSLWRCPAQTYGTCT